MTEPPGGWARGNPPALHERLSGWITDLRLAGGPADRPLVVAGSEGGDIALLDVVDGEMAGPWRVGRVQAVCVGGHPDRPVLAALAGAGHLVTVDPLVGRVEDLGGFPKPRRCLTPLAFPSLPGSESLVAIDGVRGEVEIWCLATGAKAPVASFVVDGGVTHMHSSFVESEVLLAVGTDTGQVTVWRCTRPGAESAATPAVQVMPERRIRVTTDAVPGPVTALALGDVDGKPIVLAAGTDAMQGWWSTGDVLFGPFGHGHREAATVLRPGVADGMPVIWSTDGSSLRALSLAAGTTIRSYDIPRLSDAAVMRCVLTGDQRQVMVAIGYGDGLVRTFAATDGLPTGPPPAIAKDGPARLTLLGRSSGASWNLAAPDWDNNSHYPYRVATTTTDRSQRAVVVAFTDRTVRAFLLADGSDVPLPGAAAHTIATGDRLLLGVGEGEIVTWSDPADGTLETTPAPTYLPQRGEAVVVANVDGRPVLIRDRGTDLVRFDLRTGRQVGERMRGHTDKIHGIAVVHCDGTPVALSCAQDDTVRLWDLRTGRSIGKPWGGYGGGAYAVATLSTDDGRRLAFTAGHSGEIRVHDLTALPGRFTHRHPAARTLLKVDRAVQALAPIATTTGWLLGVGAQSTAMWVDSAGEVLGRLELDDTVTDLAGTDGTLIIASGSGLYSRPIV